LRGEGDIDGKESEKADRPRAEAGLEPRGRRCEVRYGAKKTGRSKAAVRKAVKKVGNSRKRVEKRLEQIKNPSARVARAECCYVVTDVTDASN
jgi:hypothetical protein